MVTREVLNTREYPPGFQDMMNFPFVEALFGAVRVVSARGEHS